VPGPNRTSDEWSGEAKFAVVVETSVMSEAELSQYCREKGLYPEQVRSWKQDCLNDDLMRVTISLTQGATAPLLPHNRLVTAHLRM
jgi:transposase-like protein